MKRFCLFQNCFYNSPRLHPIISKFFEFHLLFGIRIFLIWNCWTFFCSILIFCLLIFAVWKDQSIKSNQDCLGLDQQLSCFDLVHRQLLAIVSCVKFLCLAHGYTFIDEYLRVSTKNVSSLSHTASFLHIFVFIVYLFS